MNNDFFENKSHVFLIFLLVIMSYCFLMFGNGIVSLTHPDEVFYIQSAKEMLAHNRWFTPMIFDEVQFEKPFLSFALFALAIKWFGLTPFVARFWPAFFGMLGVLSVYWISWLLFQKKRAAFLAATILTSSFIYLAMSRAVLTDVIFSAWVTIAIGFFVWAYYRPERKTAGLLLCGVVTAVAVLTKGLLGVCFVSGTILLFLITQRNFRFLKTPAVLWSILLFLVISLPWHVIMYWQHGQWFLDEYFGNVHVRRLFETEHPKINVWYFYPGLLLAGILPWTFYWVPAVQGVVKQVKEKTQDAPKLVFLVCWIIGVWIFVQFAACKLASYIFPVFPSVAILFGYTIEQRLRAAAQTGQAVALRCIGFIVSLILVVVSALAIFYGFQYSDFLGSFKPFILLSVLALISSLIILYFNMRKKYIILVFSTLSVSISLLALLFFVRPYIEPWVSCKHVSEMFEELNDQSDTTILASKFYVRGIRFYTDRKMAVIDINGEGFYSPHPIPFLNTDQKVIDFLDSQPFTYAIVKEGNVQDLQRIAPKADYTIEEIDGIGGKHILKLQKQKE
jgi:4-amino-4-deoxy-L-arabinose transferase-like glycosyltransferase